MEKKKDEKCSTINKEEEKELEKLQKTLTASAITTLDSFLIRNIRID
jgi:hypothetical protein